MKRVARDEMEDVDGLRYVGDIVNAALRLLLSLRAIGIPGLNEMAPASCNIRRTLVTRFALRHTQLYYLLQTFGSKYESFLLGGITWRLLGRESQSPKNRKIRRDSSDSTREI